MRISDVLRAKGGQTVTVTPDSDVRQLLTVLAEHRIGAVVVSHDGTSVGGIVSERDIVRAFAVFLIVLVVVAVVSSASAWFARRRSLDATGPQPASPGVVDPGATAEAIGRADRSGQRAEAALTTRLLAGHMSAEEYRREMASLAARDALGHPLATPPDQ